jgi:biopolymer transport protein ExbD
MAELDTSGGGGSKKGNKVRSKKMSTRVDLTAMVDLAFLLITFFMLTTTLAKPQAMDMFMPDKDKKNEDELPVKASRTMTVLLGSDNKIVWYMGVMGSTAPTVDNFGKSGIRQAFIDNNKKVLAQTGDPKKGLMVILKPTDKSNYKNFVDLLDEIKIAGVPSYGIVNKIEPEELNLMKEQGALKD